MSSLLASSRELELLARLRIRAGQLAAFATADKGSWTKSTGPRGGTIWTHSGTGAKRYQKNEPGVRGGAKPAAPKKPTLQPAGVTPPPPPKAAKPATTAPTPAKAATAPAPAPAPSNDNMNHPALRPIHDALAFLPPEKRAEYTAALSGAVRHMPPNALRDINEGGLSKARFYGSVRELTESLAEEHANIKAAMEGGAVAGGAYASGTVHLDGSAEEAAGGAYATKGRAEAIYAHELMHAVDGTDYFYSKNPAWLAAWKEEMGGKGLTEYAATAHQEGFAEFGRVLYTGDIDTAKFAAGFPKCAAFFKERKLWPAERKADKPSKPEDIFDERVPLGDPAGPDHADVKKKVAAPTKAAPRKAGLRVLRPAPKPKPAPTLHPEHTALRSAIKAHLPHLDDATLNDPAKLAAALKAGPQKAPKAPAKPRKPPGIKARAREAARQAAEVEAMRKINLV